jgi:hypothetical protein
VWYEGGNVFSGAVTIADGADVALGARADAAAANPGVAATVIAILKGIWTTLIAGLIVTPVRSATGTETDVASNVADTVILAANANRKGGTVYNEGASILYLLLSNAVSSATKYTVAMAAGSYYEIPFNYTGVLKGLWVAAAAGNNARVTEFT